MEASRTSLNLFSTESISSISTKIPLNTPIAIIGMACRFPNNITNPELFWELLVKNRNAITDVPLSRWDNSSIDLAGKINSHYGGFLNNIDCFDPSFFEISPLEAENIDPQHRLLLEVTWEALERSGINPISLKKSSTGVYIGICTNDYGILQTQSSNFQNITPYYCLGNSLSAAAGRISYFLGLHGPSKAIDTACSSSLVAIHDACRDIQSGECTMAIVGGVNAILSPINSISLSKAKMLSPDGCCKVFDENANGYVRSEGCGVVILKKLSDAEQCGDPILAVILGSLVNQDGHSNGLTAPNSEAQIKLFQENLNQINLCAQEISFIETHGTGTPLGDPIEVRSITNVYAQNRPKNLPLYLGSVKSNIGHTEAVAGITSLIKVVLALQHKHIPGQSNLTKINPLINIEETQVKIPITTIPWTNQNYARTAAVNAFGFTGTNAQVILREINDVEKSNALLIDRPYHLLTLSAKTENALLQLIESYKDYLCTSAESLADITYTTNLGRMHFPYRIAVAADNIQTLRDRLIKKEYFFDTSSSQKTLGKIAFIFSESNAIDLNAIKELYQTQFIFREALNKCNEVLNQFLPESFIDLLFSKNQELLNNIFYRKLANFAAGYSLTQLWLSLGIKPDCIFGIGPGLYLAATISGALTLEASASLLCKVSKIIESDSKEITKQEKLNDLKRLLETIKFGTPEYILISSSGEQLTCNSLSDEKYWLEHLQQSVDYISCFQVIQRLGCSIFLEIEIENTSHNSLREYVKNHMTNALWLSSLDDKNKPWISLVNNLGKLYVKGCEIDWLAFEKPYLAKRKKILLPTYPFAKESYWILKNNQASNNESLSTKFNFSLQKITNDWEQIYVSLKNKFGLVKYDKNFVQDLNSLCYNIICQVFIDLNWDKKSGEIINLIQWKQTISSAKHLQILINSFLDILIEEGTIISVTEGFKVNHDLIKTDVEKQSNYLALKYPFFKDELELLKRVSGKLAMIFHNKVDPLEILFPNDGKISLEYLYHETPLARLYASLMENLIKRLMIDAPPLEKLNILEIGAGTGGTTVSVLPFLPMNQTTYIYSDLSAWFFSNAGNRFKNYPSIRYELFNVENNPAEQNLSIRQFDLVLAANVIHATCNIRQSLQHINQLLLINGLLILVEVTEKNRWLDLTIGSLEGWGRFNDHDLRKTHPLLSEKQWKNVLNEMNFEIINIIGGKNLGLPQSIIVARKKSNISSYQEYSAFNNYRSEQNQSHNNSCSSPENHNLNSLDNLEIKNQIRKIIAKILKLNESDISDQIYFDRMGMDSLMALELRNELENIFGQGKLSNFKTILEQGNNIENLANYFQKKMKETIPGSITVIEENKLPINKIISQKDLEIIQKNIDSILNPSFLRGKVQLIIKYFFIFLSKTYIKLIVKGVEHLPKNESFILSANHASALDAIALAMAIRKHHDKKIVALAAENHFYDLPFLSLIGDMVPFDRNRNEYALAKNLEYVKICKEANKTFILLPEGTRSENGKIQEFKNGVIWFAENANLKIIPAYIDGAFQLMPKGSLFPKPGRITVTFGEPFDINSEKSKIFPDQNEDYYKNFTKKLKSAIVKLSNGLETLDEE